MRKQTPRWSITPRSPLQREWVEAKADEKQVTVSEIIRQLIDKAMEEERK